MRILLSLICLYKAVPILLQTIGLMKPDFVPLTEDGEPWTEADGDENNAVWTAQKPAPALGLAAGVASFFSLRNLF